MIGLPSAKILLGCVLAVIVASGLSYRAGVSNTRNSIAADIAREEQLAQRIYDNAIAATASEISKIEITNKTITQELEREIRTEPIYINCRHDDATKRMLDAILTGERSGESFDRSQLPAADSAGR